MINKFNQHIVKVLKIGLGFSMIVMTIGLVLFVITGQSGYQINTYPQSISEMLSGAILLKPFAIMTLGLLFLIITPVIRIITAMICFLIENDYLYVMITLSVFIILMISFVIGIVKS